MRDKDYGLKVAFMRGKDYGLKVAFMWDKDYGLKVAFMGDKDYGLKVAFMWDKDYGLKVASTSNISKYDSEYTCRRRRPPQKFGGSGYNSKLYLNNLHIYILSSILI